MKFIAGFYNDDPNEYHELVMRPCNNSLVAYDLYRFKWEGNVNCGLVHTWVLGSNDPQPDHDAWRMICEWVDHGVYGASTYQITH